jgi:hypothetical protein
MYGPTATSAVGHAATAEAMTTLLGLEIQANRITVRPRKGDTFLCFKLKQRPPEGAILDLAQLEALGFEWVFMEYIAEPLSI